MIVTKSTLCAALVLATATVSAQTTVTKPGQTTKRSATIQSIDSSDRIITLKGDDNAVTRIWAPPSTIQRFDELKVGDRVNVTYYESTIYQLRKPGDPVATAGTTASTTPAPSALPGGTAARQTTSSVTVKSVDPAVPSITVTTADGSAVTHLVADKANLAKVQVGDRIDITYTEAALVSVERGK